MAELNGKYINEENHQKVKSKLKKIGIILMIVGACLTVAGLVMLIIGFSSFGESSLDDPQGMFTSANSSMIFFIVGGFGIVIGIALLGYGGYATFFAHAREIASYGASSIAPVVGDTVNYMADNVAPSINNAVGGMAEAITSGITKGKSGSKKIKCSKCRTENNSTNKFCANCGEKLAKDKHCLNCNAKIEEGTKFCPNCGTKIDEN